MQGKAAFIGRTAAIALAMSISACSAQHATKTSVAGEASANACDVVRNWEAAGGDTQRRIPPVVDVDDGNIAYRFVPSNTSIASLKAVCGHGPYSECEVSVTLRDGTGYSFVELSRFELLYAGDALWMAYRIQSPRTDTDKNKRRVMVVTPQPIMLCNEIGDYSDLM